MAIINCPECEGKVSDQARSCPHCGFEVKPELSTPKKKPVSSLRRVIGIVVLSILLGSIAFVYMNLNREEKDALKTLASQTVVGKAIVPWSTRAESVLRITVKKSLVNIGKTIVGVTHPTGNYEGVTRWSVEKGGDVLTLTFQVSWRGGFLKKRYHTTIRWKLDQRGTISFEIPEDTALVGIGKSNRNKLETYFKKHVYNVLNSNMGGREEPVNTLSLPAAVRKVIRKTVVPWSKQAESVLRATVKRSLENIGRTIVGQTHPTGRYKNVSSWNVQRSQDTLTLKVQVYWRGGFLRKRYYTTIRWSFNKHGTTNFGIPQDTALIRVSRRNRRKLRQYFQNHVYGVVIGNLGGRK